MIFSFLISIVFIAEIIITATIIVYLIKTDKKLLELNAFVTEINPKIKDVMELVRKISEQMVEFAPMIVKNIQNTIKDMIINQVKSVIGAFTFWLVKKEVEKHV